MPPTPPGPEPLPTPLHFPGPTTTCPRGRSPSLTPFASARLAFDSTPIPLLRKGGRLSFSPGRLRRPLSLSLPQPLGFPSAPHPLNATPPFPFFVGGRDPREPCSHLLDLRLAPPSSPPTPAPARAEASGRSRPPVLLAAPRRQCAPGLATPVVSCQRYRRKLQ